MRCGRSSGTSILRRPQTRLQPRWTSSGRVTRRPAIKRWVSGFKACPVVMSCGNLLHSGCLLYTSLLLLAGGSAFFVFTITAQQACSNCKGPLTSIQSPITFTYATGRPDAATRECTNCMFAARQRWSWLWHWQPRWQDLQRSIPCLCGFQAHAALKFDVYGTRPHICDTWGYQRAPCCSCFRLIIP